RRCHALVRSFFKTPAWTKFAFMIKRVYGAVKNFLNTANFQKYFANVFWLISEKVFSLGISLVAGIYVVRYLQPEGFGMLNYAISFVRILAPFSHLGHDNIVRRALAQSPQRKK